VYFVQLGVYDKKRVFVRFRAPFILLVMGKFILRLETIAMQMKSIRIWNIKEITSKIQSKRQK
jgi:hypothetical protein